MNSCCPPPVEARANWHGARPAAHLAAHHQPAQVVAVDASPAQCAMATDLYGHLASRLHIASCDAVSHLQTMTHAYDVLYSAFDAADFTGSRELRPTAAAARCDRAGGWCSPPSPTT